MTQTLDPDLLASMRQDLHRLAVRLGAASELFRRGLGEEAAPDLLRCVNLVDDLGLMLDDMLVAEPMPAAPVAPPKPAATPAKRAKAPQVVTPHPAVVEPPAEPGPTDAHRDEEVVDVVAPEPLVVVPDVPVGAGINDVDEEEPSPSAVATGDAEVIGDWSVRTIRDRRFVRCPDFTCSKRVYLDPEDTTPAEIEQAVHGHRLTSDHKAPPVTAGAKR